MARSKKGNGERLTVNEKMETGDRKPEPGNGERLTGKWLGILGTFHFRHFSHFVDLGDGIR